MTTATAPRVAKRRLSHRLAVLRKRSGHTANHVCDMLNWGRGKVGRFEANQWKRPEMSDIRDLLRIYGVEEAEQDEIKRSRRPGPRPALVARLSARSSTTNLPGSRTTPAQIRVFMPLVLPGLLQTTDYMESFMRTGCQAAGLAGQGAGDPAAAAGDPGPHRRHRPPVSPVITEASLLYRWGPQAGSAGADRAPDRDEPPAQRRAAHPALRRRAAHRACIPWSTSSIFPGEPSTVFLETDFSIEEVASTEQAKSYIETYGRASAASLEPGDTTLYLNQLAEQLE